MISVSVDKDRNEYVGFSCIGHAGYDKYGKDIVCSSVSILVINTINSIEELTDSKFDLDTDEDKGYIKFSFLNHPSKEASLLIDSMLIGLKSISKEYKKFVRLEIKEV